MDFDFILFRGADIFLPYHALERIRRGNAIDGNERTFGESRCDAVDSSDYHRSDARHDRGFVSERNQREEKSVSQSDSPGELGPSVQIGIRVISRERLLVALPVLIRQG